jgi:ribonuclease E
MEMSRQRLRTGVLEASTKPCPHCEGTGLMRTAASAGLSALRIIEDEATRGRGEKILLRAGREAAVYVLNKKRSELADIEQRYGVSIDIAIDESFEGARMTVESSGGRPIPAPRAEIPPSKEEEDEVLDEEVLDEEDNVEISLEGEDEFEGEQERQPEGERQGRRRRRRRRGGRGRGRREGGEGEEMPAAEEPVSPEAEAAQRAQPEASPEGPAPERGRRRRRGRKQGVPETEQAAIEPDSSPLVERPIDEEPPIAETQPTEEAKPKRRRSKKAAAEAEVTVPEPAPVEAPPAETADDVTLAKPARKGAGKGKAKPVAEPADVSAPPAANNDTAEGDAARRSGWWQRTFG